MFSTSDESWLPVTSRLINTYNDNHLHAECVLHYNITTDGSKTFMQNGHIQSSQTSSTTSDLWRKYADSVFKWPNILPILLLFKSKWWDKRTKHIRVKISLTFVYQLFLGSSSTLIFVECWFLSAHVRLDWKTIESYRITRWVDNVKWSMREREFEYNCNVGISSVPQLCQVMADGWVPPFGLGWFETKLE